MSLENEDNREQMPLALSRGVPGSFMEAFMGKLFGKKLKCQYFLYISNKRHIYSFQSFSSTSKSTGRVDVLLDLKIGILGHVVN